MCNDENSRHRNAESPRRETLRRIYEIVDGFVSLASVGYGSMSGSVKGAIGKWALDLGVEQTLPVILDKFDNNQLVVFGYYIAKFAFEAKKGELEEVMDYILKAGELGIETDKITKDLMVKFHIDLEMPKNLATAVEQEVEKNY